MDQKTNPIEPNRHICATCTHYRRGLGPKKHCTHPEYLDRGLISYERNWDLDCPAWKWTMEKVKSVPVVDKIFLEGDRMKDDN